MISQYLVVCFRKNNTLL